MIVYLDDSQKVLHLMQSCNNFKNNIQSTLNQYI